MAASGNPLWVVVFGGIGSGKSTVARLLRDKGALFIEADSLGHEVLMPGGAAYDDVAARWPEVVKNCHIDRAALAAIVFASDAELQDLEALTHPHIGAEIERLAAAAGDQPVVVELPVVGKIVGEGWTTVLVDAPAELRLRRAIARGAAEDDVIARMDAQPTEAVWHEAADWVVPNVGSPAELAVAAEELWDQLTAKTDI